MQTINKYCQKGCLTAKPICLQHECQVGAGLAEQFHSAGTSLKRVKTHLTRINSLRLILSGFYVLLRGPPALVDHYSAVKVLFIFGNVFH